MSNLNTKMIMSLINDTNSSLYYNTVGEYIEKYMSSDDVNFNFLVLQQQTMDYSNLHLFDSFFSNIENYKFEEIYNKFMLSTINHITPELLKDLTNNFSYDTKFYFISYFFVSHYSKFSDEVKAVFLNNIATKYNKEMLLSENNEKLFYQILNLDNTQEIKEYYDYTDKKVLNSFTKDNWLNIFEKFPKALDYFCNNGYILQLFSLNVLDFNSIQVKQELNKIINGLADEEKTYYSVKTEITPLLIHLLNALDNQAISKQDYESTVNKIFINQIAYDEYFNLLSFDLKLIFIQNSKNFRELSQIDLKDYTKDEKIKLSNVIKSRLVGYNEFNLDSHISNLNDLIKKNVVDEWLCLSYNTKMKAKPLLKLLMM